MGWKQWSAVAVVIGGGLLLQIPTHNDADMDHGAMGHREMPADMAAAHGSFHTVTFDITGMTCAGCATAARVAVERIEAVREATFSYEQAEGLVTFDTTATSVTEIIGELDRLTGFGATVRARQTR